MLFLLEYTIGNSRFEKQRIVYVTYLVFLYTNILVNASKMIVRSFLDLFKAFTIVCRGILDNLQVIGVQGKSYLMNRKQYAVLVPQDSLPLYYVVQGQTSI